MIRLANENDLDKIMEIIREVQKEMKSYNNPQWNEENDYPNKEKFLSDITKEQLYIYDDNKIIKGFMVISKEDDYEDLLETTNKKAYVLHRLAISKDYRNEGLAIKFFKYAEDLAKENNIEILKADTEEHNIKMNSLFIKLGFEKKGEFEYDDYPGHYIYYEKSIIKMENNKIEIYNFLRIVAFILLITYVTIFIILVKYKVFAFYLVFALPVVFIVIPITIIISILMLIISTYKIRKIKKRIE